jgi:protein phosphatase
MKPVDKPHLLVGALSHPGEQRDHNEDRYSVTAYQLSRGGQPALLAVVADGIGGHQAGEVAAEMAVEAVVERVASSSGRDPLPTLRAAIADAANAVIKASHENPELEGMGSTLAIVWVIGRHLYLAYVGDSRIYMVSQDKIQQVSNDHTWVQEALENEIISPEEAVDHPHAHVLRRHIGGEKPPEPDLRIRLEPDAEQGGSSSHQGLELQVGDTMLLCSDGLTDLVTGEEIGEILGQKAPAEAVHQLVDMARERGGHDNITVVALRVPATPIPQSKRGCSRPLLLAGLVGLAALAAGALITWRLNVWPWNSLLTGAGRGRSEPTSQVTASATEVPAADALLTTPTLTATPTPTSGPTSTPVPLATVAGSESE